MSTKNTMSSFASPVRSANSSAHGKGDFVEFRPALSYDTRNLQGDGDAYLAGLPSLAGLRSASMANPYYRLRDKQRKQRLESDYNTLMSEFNAYKEFADKMFGATHSLRTEYDQSVILPTTCALGFTKPHHFDLDEKGQLGVQRRFLFPEESVVDATKFYFNLANSVNSTDLADISVSMPRGKNTGWPTPRAQRSRDQSDMLLALHAAFVRAGVRAQHDLSALVKEIERYHSPVIAVNGERYQHAGKLLPVIINKKEVLFSNNFEPRVRGIYFSPKFCVMWNRFPVKLALHLVLSNPIHTQDRHEIHKKITAAKQQGMVLLSLDVSKFDHSFGRDCGRQLLRTWADILARIYSAQLAPVPPTLSYSDRKQLANRIYSDFNTEFSIPFLVPNHSGLFISNGAEILSSGLSLTTIVGCLASELMGLYILKKQFGLTRSDVLNGKCLLLTYGDDMVIGVPKSFAKDADALLASCTEVGDEMELKFSAEPTIKFLGQNYDTLKFGNDARDLAYPVGRFLQQQFFPERMKQYPFSAIGTAARLDLLSSTVRDRTFQAIRSFLAEDIRDLNFSDSTALIMSLMPEVQKYSDKISQLDDILGVMTHGLMDEELMQLEDNEVYRKLLGLGSIDINFSDDSWSTDSEFNEVIRPIMPYLSDISHGKWSSYPSLLSQLMNTLKTNQSPIGTVLF